MMALRSTETHDITLKTWPYLGPNSATSGVPTNEIARFGKEHNNAVEFSLRMMQVS